MKGKHKMRTLTKLKNSTSGAAFTEYAILAGLIGVVVLTATLNLGETVNETFSDVDGVLVAQGLTPGDEETATTPSVNTPTPVIDTWQTISATPYTPNTSGRDSGRFYEEFVVVLVENSPGVYHHTYSFAANHNPAEIADTADLDPFGASFIGLPVAPPTGAAGLCTEASSHTGTIMDPSESFFPPMFGGDDSDIQVEDFISVTLGDELAHLGDQYVVHTGAGSSTTPTFGPGETIQAIYAFTCSRPI